MRHTEQRSRSNALLQELDSSGDARSFSFKGALQHNNAIHGSDWRPRRNQEPIPKYENKNAREHDHDRQKQKNAETVTLRQSAKIVASGSVLAGAPSAMPSNLDRLRGFVPS